MSLESIALIGILTLFTVILGTELATLLIGHSPLEAINSERLSAIAQGHRSIGWRVGLIFLLLLAGAVVINLVPATRTERYLLRIGLGSLLVYLVLLFCSLLPVGDGVSADLLARTAEIVNSNSQSNIPLWQRAWMLLIWPRAITALVSYWSFLHYAMNPKT
ncbi:MAG: hypothetical protein AAFR58_08925 [Cyanobacteria bacterium J06627_28]